MLDQAEKLMAVLARHDVATVRAAYISRVRLETGRITDARKWMADNGFELLDVSAPRLLADDGREILRAHGKAWVLKPEVHAQRLAEALEQAKQRDAAKKQAEQQSPPPEKREQPTTCTALIDGQLCGGTLINTPVCPRCALGKSGVAATRTCDVCGHVTAVMRGDS